MAFARKQGQNDNHSTDSENRFGTYIVNFQGDRLEP